MKNKLSSEFRDSSRPPWPVAGHPASRPAMRWHQRDPLLTRNFQEPKHKQHLFRGAMVSRRFRLPKTGASRCVATCEQSNAGAVNASFSSGDQDQSIWSMNPLGTTSQNSLFFKAPACSACHIDLTDTSRNQALRHGASFRTTWTCWVLHGGKDPPSECFPENGVTQRCPKTADAM